VWLRVKSLRDCSSTAEGLFFDSGLGIILHILCLGFLSVKFGKEEENKIFLRKEK
jgi:hypothetical protein